jgi:TonB family protein
MRGMKTLSLAVMLLTLSGVEISSGSPVQQDDEATLLTAAGEGRVDDVRALLDAGLDVNARNEDAWTPLLYAALGGHPEVVNLLLEYGADVNASNSAGWTPLIAAAMSGRAEVVGMLLERGADVNAGDTSGQTALMYAARGGHTEAVALLLDYGVDVNAKEEEGETPLTAAEAAGHVEVVKLLLKGGADVTGAVWEPSTARPEVRDQARAGQIISSRWPASLLEAGIGGTVYVWAFVDTDGRVRDARVIIRSGEALLDFAALRAVREIEFNPARRNGEAVAAWLVFPVTFGTPPSITVMPEIRDPTRMTELINRYYPMHLWDAGISGTVVFEVHIDASGRVERAEVTRNSGHPALDRAALRAVRELLFTPALRDGVPVAMSMTFAIRFSRW